MRAEKEGSKGGGGYVGGFFQLFDWTAKSRKKLFSSKSDLPVLSKQGKRINGNFPVTNFQLQVEEDEPGVGSSIKENSDYSCASSVTDDDGSGAKAPGVVARLMGLDSLPMVNHSEPYSTPFFDTKSLQDAHHRRKNIDIHDNDFICSGNVLNKVEVPSENFESKPQRTLGRPIEKFQTEILPPKSAKSIPVTHHKLLSPIKTPGFIPSKDAAHIMEAAAKIIVPGTQSTSKSKMPTLGSSLLPLKVRDCKEKEGAAQNIGLVGSSSVPFKVRDLGKRVEDTQKASLHAETFRRPVESNAAKYLKGQSLNKSWNGSVETTSFQASDPEEGSASLKHKGKSISLAVQAKVNVQKRGLNSSRSESLVGQKEHIEAKSSQPLKIQQNTQKNLHKKPSLPNASGVLRQNNQKQNCVIDIDKPLLKHSVSQSRKLMSGDPYTGRQKTSRKTVANSNTGSKIGLDATDNGKENSYSREKIVPRKKRLTNGEFSSGKNQVVDSVLSHNNQKRPQSKHMFNGQYSWYEDSKNNGTDVVSFTFTAPLSRPVHGSDTSGPVPRKYNNACLDDWGKGLYLDSDKLSSVRNNIMGGDALSTLLEQKLRELSYKVEASSHNPVKLESGSSFGSLLPDPRHTRSSIGTTQDNEINQHVQWPDKLVSYCDSVLYSSNPTAHGLKQKFQDDARNLLDCQQPSPISEPSCSTKSCISSETADSSSCIDGSKLYPSVKAEKIISLSSLRKFPSVEPETEFSDSASSTSIKTISRKNANLISIKEPARLAKLELEYVKDILYNVESRFRGFALGEAREIINPHLFYQLESRTKGLKHANRSCKLEWKLLFDCVSECLDVRCQRLAGGGCRRWNEGVRMVKTKDRLAEQVHKEINGWRNMSICQVDELVDKDMSTQQGGWLDFEVDAFVLGTELEDLILNSLVDELITDIFRF